MYVETEHDPLSGITRRFYTDAGTGLEVIHSHQDCEGIVEMNKALLNAPRPSSRLHHGGTEKFYRVASIPRLEIERWMQQGINFFTNEGFEFVTKRLLNDSEYAHFRTAPGRL